ncbi:MAG: DNA gyrase subunit A [Candidatus Midichloria sp.]|nr:DNA gyrase subunit A [Candidatus Midichloria sp.]
MEKDQNNSVVKVSIENEMQKSYLDYAMSVIVSRALPDCRDGLKPVHRRVLYAMHETGNTHDKPYRKSARIVGEVLGKYHPHGNDPVYLSMVRMAQDFSLRDPLIDGQGNFGSMDGDSPAQMRYTEVRLAKVAAALLFDIENNTVDFQDNYDGSEKEPKVLPARFPNLLINGANGIAVGMATNIPPHNMGEVLDACIAYIKNDQITPEELLEYVHGPDFPTGGEILGINRIRQALLTGRGSITLRGKVEIEAFGSRRALIITEVPYQVNKAELIKSVEELLKEKVIEGISEIRDETNKLGVRVVIELKRDVVPEVMLNQLYSHTQLQISFAVNMLALLDGRPTVMNIHSVVRAFVKFREEVVRRRTSFLLTKARDKAHVLIGLAIAVANIDEVITLIKNSADPNEAKVQLLNRKWSAEVVLPLLKLVDDYRNEIKDGVCHLTEEQVKAILEMRLQRLTGLEKSKVDQDLAELGTEIADYLEILGSTQRLYSIIKSELKEIKDRFATPRRTQIITDQIDVSDEDLIQREDMVVTVTRSGYIKRVPLATYKAQKRGGKGRSAIQVNDDDITTDVIITDTHTSLLFFSDSGKVYKIKVYKLPLGSLQSKGRVLVNILNLSTAEKITNIMQVNDQDLLGDGLYIVFATAKGNARRNALSDFARIQSNGKVAIKMDEDDKLIGVVVCTEFDHIMLSTQQGKSIRFSVEALRVFKSRASDGVKAVKLAKKDDKVVSIAVLNGIAIEQDKKDEYLKIPVEKRLEIAKLDSVMLVEHAIANFNLALINTEEVLSLAKNEEFILVVTENGFGKRTSAYEYRITNRGGQGITNVNITPKNGKVISTFPIKADEDIMLMTGAGTVIRTQADTIRITGRGAVGVKIITVQDAEKVTAVAKIPNDNSELDIENHQLSL